MSDVRSQLNAWLQAITGHSVPEAGVVGAFCAKVKELYHLDLVTNWNPSSCTFDARWQHAGRAAEGIEKPFSAEAQDAAQLLACVALVHLLQNLEKQ
jgi:hypothetical protein